MKKIIKHKMAELFCGPGGLALGAKRSKATEGNLIYRIEPVWATDIDQEACNSYRNNIHRNVICDAIEKIDLKKLPKFNGLCFGFPCNDFSRVGEQRGIKGKYGPLYIYAVKTLKIHKPDWFVAENVAGLSNADNGKTLKNMLYEFKKAGKGYKLTNHLYKLEEYGVPQQRHRIIIIGIRKDLNLKFQVPAPTTPNDYISAREVIENPPINPACPNHEFKKQMPHVTKRLEYIPPGKNVWHKKVPKKLRLNTKTQLSNIYRRLSPDEPAYTVTGSGGGGTYMYHWKENRALTNRERARLQTFPDTFIFSGSYGNVRKQIGMAVPPKVAQVIFEALLKTFAGIDYDTVKPSFLLE